MPSDRFFLRGVLLCTAAALCWSSAGLLVRLVATDGWTTSFWRSTFMAATILVFLLARHGRDTAREFRLMGRTGVMLAASYALTFTCFILALSMTTVANTVVIMAATPLFAAVFAWLWLGERLSAGMIAAMLFAAAGIAVMVGESMGASGILGDLLALGVAVTQGANVVFLRHGRAGNMIPALCLAGVLSAVAALPFATPLAVSTPDLAILATLGAVQLGLGLVLFSLGVRDLPVAVAGLLALLETVLSPVWAWLGVGERPSNLAIAGGAMVIAALWLQTWRGRP